MKKIFLFTIIAAVLIILFPLDIKAGTVLPTGEISSQDVWNIDDELDATGYVRLQEGGIYYLSHYIPLNSNSTIDARGATIFINKGAVRNDPLNYTVGYDSMSNIKIIGGTWVSFWDQGCTGTTFSFAHSQNITLKDMDIRSTNAEGHAIELVACKDVSISNCNIVAQGTGAWNSVEEMIQIDLAAPHNAPFLSAEYQNGLTCQNITISRCRIVGNRGVSASFAKNDPQFLNRYHDNIVVKNCNITGNTAEGLALFNTPNAIVKYNRIISNSIRTKTAYSSGCHVTLFGKIRAFAKGKISIRNNVIKGGWTGFQITSHYKTRYGKLSIRNNKIFAKKGKKRALVIFLNPKKKPSVIKVSASGNKLRKWKK